MVTALSLVAVFSFTGPMIQTAVEADFSEDLFLIGNNSPVIDQSDWYGGQTNCEAEALLVSAVKRLPTGHETYMIIDGADCSVFPTMRHREARFISWLGNGEPAPGSKKPFTGIRYVGAAGVTFFPELFTPSRSYTMFSSLQIPNDLHLTIQDLISYRTSTKSAKPQDHSSPASTVLVSTTSVDESIQTIDSLTNDFRGVCFCAWGIKEGSRPNIVSFPPAGVVAHYILFRKDQRMGLRLVEFLGSAKI